MKRHIYFSPDFLFVFLLAAAISCLVLGAVFQKIWILAVGLVIALYLFYRVFSRNLPARAKENEIFCAFFFALPRLCHRFWRKHVTDRKHIRSHCPACGAKLRFPRQRGDFTVTCPACGTRFPIHIR